MKTPTLQKELRHFVSDMVSVEEQALVQMVSAPDMAGTTELSENFRRHREETEAHARRMGERLNTLGGDHSAVKNAVMKTGGKGFLLFAKKQPDTPGKLHAHAYSYESMEWAGYEILIRLSKHADDSETMQIAQEIQREEQAMMERLEAEFDDACNASHPDTDREELQNKIPSYLSDAHALNVQSIKFLKKSAKQAPTSEVTKIYQDQLVVSKDQKKQIKQRQQQLDSSPSFFKDKALAAGAFNWRHFFNAHSDTPFKLAGFTYALKHLEIGAYELLRRTAEEAGDEATVRLCETLLLEEKGLAMRLQRALPRLVDAMVRNNFA